MASSLADAQAAGVDAAPTFYLALTNQQGTTVKSDTKLVGALPYTAFQAALDKLIASIPDK